MELADCFYAHQNDWRTGAKALNDHDKRQEQNRIYDDRDRGGVDHPLRNDHGPRIIATCRVPQHPINIRGEYDAIRFLGPK